MIIFYKTYFASDKIHYVNYRCMQFFYELMPQGAQSILGSLLKILLIIRHAIKKRKIH